MTMRCVAAVLLGIMGSLPAVAQTNFFWTNLAGGAWSSVVWTNDTGAGATVPVTGGSNDYIINFTTITPAFNSTNDLGLVANNGFVLNQLVFNNEAVTLFGSNLVFVSNNAGALPQVVQSGASNVVINNNLVLSNNTTFNFGTASTNTLNGVVSGAGSLTKTGAGLLALNSINNSFSNVVILGGTIAITNLNNLGATPSSAAGGVSNVIINGGTLLNSTTSTDIQLSSNRGFAIGSNGATFAAAGGILRIQGVISDLAGQSGGTITNSGATILFSGYNTYSGNTLLAAGSATVASGNHVFGNGILIMAGGSLRTPNGVGNSENISNNVVLAGDTSFNSTGASPNTLAFVGSITITNASRTLTVNQSILISGVVGDNGQGLGLIKAGPSNLTLTAANTYSGNTTLSAGALVVSNALALQNSTLNFTNGTAVFGTGLTNFTLGGLAGTQNLGLTNSGGSALSLTVGGNSGSTAYSGNLSEGSGTGAGAALVKLGSGTLTLSGTNSYTGGSTVAAGTLQVSRTVALAGYNISGKVAVSNGAVLAVNVGGAGQWAAGDVDALLSNALFANGAFLGLDTTGGSFAYGSNISGGLGLSKLGSNTLTLTGTNTFGGGTLLSAGTLSIAAYTNLPVGNLNFSGGILQVTGTQITNLNPYAVNWTNFSGGLDVNNAGNVLVVTNAIGGAGGLGKYGAGTLILAGVNTFSNGLLIAGGTLNVTNETALGTAGNGTTVGSLVLTNGGTFQSSGSFILNNRAVSLQAGGGVFSPDGSTTLTITNAITGAGSLTKLGAGTLALSGVNIFSNTLILAGVLTITNDNALGVVPGVAAASNIIINGGTLNFSGPSTILSSTRGIAVGSNTATIFTSTTGGAFLPDVIGDLAGQVGIVILTNALSGGTLVLEGANTYSGGTIIQPNAVVAIDVASVGSVGAITSGALGIGDVTIRGGTLRARNGNRTLLNSLTLAGDFSYISGAAADGVLTLAGPVVITNGNRTITQTSSSNLIFAGVISDGGLGYGLTKAGAGPLILAGANTYRGNTTLSAGALMISNTLALQNSTLNFTGGTNIFGAGITSFTWGGLAGNQNIGLTNVDGSTVALAVGGNTSNTIYSGVLSQSGSLTKLGTGTLTFSGANTYTGGTFINVGALSLTGSGALGNGNISIASGATLDASGRTSTFTLTSGQSLTNRGTVVGGLIVGNNATASGGGYYAGVVTNQSGGTLTPGTGGDTNVFGTGLTLAGGSTNAFWVGSVTTHDMSVVSNSLAFTGSGHPVLTLNLGSYVQSANPTNGVIMLYQNLGSSVFDGTNQWFTLSDGGPSNNWNLRNGTTFEAVGGSSATNEFTIWYDLDTTGTSHTGTSIALAVIPEPASVNLFLMLGAAYWLRRRLHGKQRRWRG